MYCFLPSLHAEKGSVRIYNYMPEVVKDFLYCININHIKVFAGPCDMEETFSKPIEKRVVKGKNDKVFISANMKRKFLKVKGNKDVLCKEFQSMNLKDKNNEKKERINSKKESFLVPSGIKCFNRFSQLENYSCERQCSEEVEEIPVRYSDFETNNETIKSKKGLRIKRKIFSRMHVEADKYNTGALVQKYEAGIKGFFKDEELVSFSSMCLLLPVNLTKTVCLSFQVREFKKLESVKDKLIFIWKSKSMQV